jgi:hypothetical protein
MNVRHKPIWLIALTLLLAGCRSPAEAAFTAEYTPPPGTTQTPWPSLPPDDCPVTRPPAEPFVPPDPYGPYPYDGYSGYGTPDLWTDIPNDGRWHALPFTEGKGYTQKVVFWAKDYDWQTNPQPDLTLTGRRLDGDAPIIDSRHATNGYNPDVGAFILTGVEVPALGCWELTGAFEGAVLTIVVWVAP